MLAILVFLGFINCLLFCCRHLLLSYLAKLLAFLKVCCCTASNRLFLRFVSACHTGLFRTFGMWSSGVMCRPHGHLILPDSYLVAYLFSKCPRLCCVCIVNSIKAAILQLISFWRLALHNLLKAMDFFYLFVRVLRLTFGQIVYGKSINWRVQKIVIVIAFTFLWSVTYLYLRSWLDILACCSCK